MKIGILGSTCVGQSLGHGFTELGHEVKIGARNLQQDGLQRWLSENKQASAGSFAEAAAFGELVVFATEWDETEETIKQSGPKSFSGKVILDLSNPLDSAAGECWKQAEQPDSGGERLQRRLPGARVVGAFNPTGNAYLFHPNFEEGQPELFICGNDAAAKKEVAGLFADFGWPVVDLGPIEASRYLEPLAMGWVTHGLNGRCSRRFCARSHCTYLPFCLEANRSQAQTA
jgi:predicted dinucleotide-binding enzyme